MDNDADDTPDDVNRCVMGGEHNLLCTADDGHENAALPLIENPALPTADT